MKKLAIVASSTSCLDYIDHNYDIKIIRCKILMNDKVYEDFIDITAQEFYQKLLDDTSLVPSSSMPSMGEILEVFENLDKEGYDQILLIPISSGLSSFYDTALMAKNEFDGNAEVFVFDSKNAAASEGLLSLEAAKMRDEGKSIEQILHKLDYMVKHRRQFFLVDNLRLFIANGRLSGASGFVGSLLKIKPILIVDDDGFIVSYEKIRTSKKSINKMMSDFFKEMDELGLTKNEDFIITYDTSNATEKYEYIKNMVDEKFPGCRQVPAPITPVIGCHTGTGVVGIAYFDLSKYDAI